MEEPAPISVFEICLKHGWGIPARDFLCLYKMVEKRMFVSSFVDLDFSLLKCNFPSGFNDSSPPIQGVVERLRGDNVSAAKSCQLHLANLDMFSLGTVISI